MTNTRRRVLATALLFPATAGAQSSPVDRAHLPAAIDSIAKVALDQGSTAGMSIAVVRGRDTILLKGYGKADLELDVATPDRAIYEIGSATKQFTAAAILQLAEQGKLSLDDDMSKYLPTYPMQGKRVTIRRLLDHTSGIKGYTELPEFGALMSRQLARDSLVALVSSKPFDFEPGEAMIYNNSAYFLLGMIIEKVSGQAYGEYVKRNLFDRAGMVDSRYCSNSDVVKRRAHGYDTRGTTLVLATYIDHTWPYSAGSLCSTAWDLVAWNQALHGGRLLSAASYRELITPGTLVDGTRIRYAKGLAVDSLYGRRAIFHGGDIPGFATQLMYFPDDALTIAVLINTEGPVRPDAIGNTIAGLIYGKPVAAPTATFTGSLADYAGEYRGASRGREMVVTVAPDSTNSTLTWRLGDRGRPSPLTYLGGDTWQLSSARIVFGRKNGAVQSVGMDNVFGYYLLKRKQ